MLRQLTRQQIAALKPGNRVWAEITDVPGEEDRRYRAVVTHNAGDIVTVEEACAEKDRDDDLFMELVVADYADNGDHPHHRIFV